MAQTPARFVQEQGVIDYTPVSAVTAGDVVLIGTVPAIAANDIAASSPGSVAIDGIFDVPKNSDSWSAGDAVYWDTNEDPVVGTAGTGAASTTSSGNNLMGFATKDAASGDTYVRVRLTPYVPAA